MSRIHPEDPRVTAHALGELGGTEAAAIEKAALLNPAVAEAIEETRQLAGYLESVLGTQELVLDPDRREAIRQAGREPEAERIVAMDRSRRWGRAATVTGAAAALLVGAVWVMIKIPAGEAELSFAEESAERREAQLQTLLAPVSAPVPRGSAEGPSPSAPAAALQTGVPARDIAGEEHRALRRLLDENPTAFFEGVERTARTAKLEEFRKLPALVDNDYLSARESPRARVPLVAGTASFPMVERFVRGQRSLPPRNVVRIEELVNHIPYEEPDDAHRDGIHLGTELVRSPWDEKTILLGVLLQNKSGRMLPADANLELNIDSEWVRSYRLLGYARPAGEGTPGGPVPQSLGPGESNYLLYELQPAREAVFSTTEVLLKAGLVFRSPGKTSPGVLLCPATSPPRDWVAASGNFQVASTLAAYGLLLRDSPYRGGLDASGLRRLAVEAGQTVPEEDETRREALQLVLETLPLLEAGN